METLLKTKMGAPGDTLYVTGEGVVVEATAWQQSVEKLTPTEVQSLTPAEIPGKVEERMDFIHQLIVAALEDEEEDADDEDLDEELDEMDDVDVEDDADLDDADLDDDEDLDLDLDDDEEEAEDDLA